MNSLESVSSLQTLHFAPSSATYINNGTYPPSQAQWDGAEGRFYLAAFVLSLAVWKTENQVSSNQTEASTSRD